ncbi:MAG: signal peptidase II [Gammaproteobacteria bacterium]|nr:signal peptidase II [Gammaproteobacteria bacterium]
MIIIYLIALIAIVVDQVTKLTVMNTMELGESITIIKNFFYINYVKNDGVAFGFEFTSSKTANLIIQLLIAAVCLALFIYLSTKIKKFKDNKWFSISLGIMIGGLIGNVIDRIFYSTHSVTDFLSFILYYPWFVEGKLKILSFPFAVFNIADSCLNVGVFMMVIYLLFIEPKKNKKEEKNEDNKDSQDEVVNLKE